MSDLTRDTLPTPAQRAAAKLVPVEVLGGTLYVRPMSVRAWQQLPEGDEAAVLHLLTQSVVFANGDQVWENGEAVVDYTTDDLKPLLDAVRRLYGMGEDKSALEDRKGN